MHRHASRPAEAAVFVEFRGGLDRFLRHFPYYLDGGSKLTRPSDFATTLRLRTSECNT
jgi:hypothetical protein